MTGAPGATGRHEPGILGAPNSPFTLRIVLAARAKGLDFTALPLPPGGLRSPVFTAINPAAKIPVLITQAGLAISESTVILEYLEERYPRPGLLPADPDERGFMRMAIAMTDHYFMAPVIRLFPHLDPARRSDAVCESEVGFWRAGLGHLDRLLTRHFAPTEAPLSMVACVLAPSFHLGTRIASMIGLREDPLAKFPRLAEIYDSLKRDAIIGPALEAMTDAQEAKDIASGLPSIAHRHR